MPRGRPPLSPEQIADTRARIASCALELFREEGYAGISVRRLAHAADCTPTTLYNYFENKFEILRVIWADALGELFDHLDGLASSESHAERRLHTVALAYVEFWLAHRDQYFVVYMSEGLTQEEVSFFISDDSAVVARFDLFRSCVADAVGGAASDDDIQVLAEVLVCGLNGITQGLITMSGYPWSTPEKLVHSLTSAVLATRSLS